MLISAFICTGQVVTCTSGDMPFIEFNERTLEFLYEPTETYYRMGEEYGYSETLCENSVSYENNRIILFISGREMSLVYSEDCRFIKQLSLYDDRGFLTYVVDFPVPLKFD